MASKKDIRRLAKALENDPAFAALADQVLKFQLLDEAVQKARAANAYRAHVYDLAKSGNRNAQAELARTAAPPSDDEVRAYSERILKSSTSAEARWLAMSALDRLDPAHAQLAALHEPEQLRKAAIESAGDSEVRAYAEHVLKSSASPTLRRMAEAELDRLNSRALDRRQGGNGG